MATISYDQIALVYPVSHIAALLRSVDASSDNEPDEIPTFLDFDNKSIVLKALHTMLW